MANHKAKTTHKPPSRARYEQSHRTMSCRLDKDTRDLLNQRLEDLGGVSFADFVKDSLGLLQLKTPDVNLMRKTASEEGYKQAKKDYEVWVFCIKCRKPIYIQPNTDIHKAIIGYADEHRWKHGDC